jgi:hypothetical protein
MLEYMGLAQIRIPEIPKKISKAHSFVERGKVGSLYSHLACGNGGSHV